MKTLKVLSALLSYPTADLLAAADDLERVLAAERDIKSGRQNVFAGTLRDDRGRVKLPSGQVLYDSDLLSMDYFVLGVRGDLPTPKAPNGPTN